jgi:hypothetical protein
MTELFAILLALASSQEPATTRPADVPPPAAAASTAPLVGSKVWLDRQAEFEQFLKTAPIERIADVPIGVTRPRRAYFAPGGLAGSAVVKKLPPALSKGYWESYKSEIAAYELDKLLQMDMVPVTVERRVEGDKMSAQLWVEDCQLLKKLEGQSSPNIVEWNRQVYRQRTFDDLIGNIDRNAGNLLIDPAWNMILIDHSRAFTSGASMPFEKQRSRIDRAFFERLVALDFTTLKQRIGPWVLEDKWLLALLKRRDKIVQQFRDLAAARGEDQVFVP